MTAPSPQLQVNGITDIILRKNFQNLYNYFQAQNQLLNFQFLELNFTAAVTAQPIAHNLGVIPQDIIVTKNTGSGTATFLHGKFTTTQMFITTTGPCRVRFFYGTYFNFQSQVNNLSTDSTANGGILQLLQTLITALENMSIDVQGIGPAQATIDPTSVAALKSIATKIGALPQ